MRFASSRVALALLASTSLPVAAPAATFIYLAQLSGSSQVPPISSTGYGVALVSYTDTTNSLMVSASFAGLTGTTMAAHIHCCSMIGTNAPVATPVPSFSGFPMGVTNGTYTTTLDLTSAASYNPAFLATYGSVSAAQAAFVNGLNNGLTYFNVHTSLYPDGEIRGQLVPLQSVPEPATWMLAIVGFGAVGIAMRRERRVRVNFA